MMEWFHRWPRPLVMWLGVVVIVLLLAFFVAIGSAIAYAYISAAEEGRSVPDMSGGIAAILTAVATLVPALAQAWRIFDRRSVERLDQQARGIPPSGVPFPRPSEPSPTGGLVNNQAIEEA